MRLRRRDALLGVLGAEMRRDRARMGCFVITLLGEADAESTQWLRRRALHQGDHQRRIDAAREQGAERYVRHYAQCDRACQGVMQLLNGFAVAADEGRRYRVRDLTAQGPVRLGQRAQAVPRDAQRMGGRQLGETAEDTGWIGHVVTPEIGRQHVAVQGRRTRAQRQQRLQLRAEHEIAVQHAVVQRFLAKAIARQMQLLAFAIPQGERKHTVQTRQGRAQAVARNGLEQYFGVGMTTQRRAVAHQACAQLGEVVDLAVVDQHVARVVRVHGLRAARREIDHRQPTMTQPHAAVLVLPGATRVRAAMDKRIDGPRRAINIDAAPARTTQQTYDAAHGEILNAFMRHAPPWSRDTHRHSVPPPRRG